MRDEIYALRLDQPSQGWYCTAGRQAFLTGFLYSLLRVPPACSYSGESSSKLDLMAPRTRTTILFNAFA